MNHFAGAIAVKFDEVMAAITSHGRHDVFRLECLQTYTVPSEQESFDAFRRGVKPDESGMASWTKIITDNKDRGVTMRRARMVEKPLSEYLKFEIEWGYRFSVPAGEAITTLDASDLAGFDVTPDFWLIDDTVAYVLNYDDRFRHVSNIKITEAADLALLGRLKNRALEASRPIQSEEFWSCS